MNKQKPSKKASKSKKRGDNDASAKDFSIPEIKKPKRTDQTRHFLSSIAEESEDSIIVLDLQDTIITWNTASERLFGLTAQESAGKSLSRLSLPSEFEKLVEKIVKLKSKRMVEAADSVNLYKGRRKIKIEFKISLVTDSSGEIIGTTIIARDRTRRRSADKALRESEMRLQNAISIETVGIIFYKPDGTITEANDAFLKMSGYTRDDILSGKARSDHLTAPEYMDVTLRSRDELLKYGEFAPYEKQYIKPDGTLCWGLFAGKCLNDEECVEFIVDITESKRVEEEKRKTEQRLRQMMESVSDYAIIFTDPEGIVTSWNAGAEIIFGWTEDEILGRSADVIFVPEDRKHGIPEKERSTALMHGRADDERFHLHKSGIRFYVSGVMTTLGEDAHEGFVKICRDQTAKLEAEQSVQEKEMLRRLVSALEDERRRIARDIHDHFGQQLTALRLMLDALKKSAVDDPEMTEKVAEAEQAAAALDANVDFIAWELRPAALDDLGLRTTLANFLSEWSEHTGIESEFHVAGLSRKRLEYEIETNLYRIAQEALNNIYKHAGAEKVSVLLEKSRNKVSLIIEDDGIGFNPSDKANRRKGIGLVGMIERAKICGGSLEIESAKGRGTTVFARVPLKN